MHFDCLGTYNATTYYKGNPWDRMYSIYGLHTSYMCPIENSRGFMQFE